MWLASRFPETIMRDPAKALIRTSWHGPHSDGAGVETAGVVVGIEAYRQEQTPNSRVADFPSGKQMDPAIVGGRSRNI
jgi:hypothetical protein